MKKNVVWSTLSTIITIVVMGLLVTGMIVCRGSEYKFNILAAVVGIIFLFMWIYSPMWLSVSDKEIRIRKRVCSKRIPIADVVEVEAFSPPRWGNKRVCGSGGFAGYWGWFNDASVGTYFAYYGDPAECFILRLRNGRSYVLGCVDAASVADYIRSMIKQ